jgi:hypothetical protein
MNTTHQPARRSTPRASTRRAPAPADCDELSAGNAGFEAFEAFEAATPEERAEYCRGWRFGVGHGLVGGAVLGAVAALAAVWLGVQVGLGAL